MSSHRAEALVERVVRQSPLRRLIDPSRAVRFVEFCAVGGTGAVLDIAVTAGLLMAGSHYLAANAAGFVLAVTWNFAGNWLITYDRPDGQIGRQYVTYVGLHGLTFALRVGVVAVGVELLGVAALPASLIGLGVAALTNFAGTEWVFRGEGRIWFDAVEAANHAAHLIYGSRLRSVLVATGLYDLLYGTYARALAYSYSADERDVSVGDATGTLATVEPGETVSVLHTLEKERPVLEAFVAEVEPSDHVVDVGANVGVFSVLAGDLAARVTAVEAHPATAERCRENLADTRATTTVIAGALGERDREVELAVQRDEVGTQRPSVAVDGELTVAQHRGDTVFDTTAPTPDVVKIDVEGAEAAVVRGLQDTLRECRVVFLETHGDTTAVDRLERLGFDCHCLGVDAAEQQYYRGVNVDR